MTRHLPPREDAPSICLRGAGRVLVAVLAVVTIVAGLLMLSSDADAAVRPSVYKKASTAERHVPVQIIRLAVKTSPLPSEERAVELYEDARRYWDHVSEGRYTLLQDGPVMTAYSNSPTCWCNDNPRLPGYGESDLPRRPHSDTVQLLVSEYGLMNSRGGGKRVFLNKTADAHASAHEFGHVFGLGHSTGFDPEGNVEEYSNTWSIMGSGQGAPDGAMMQQLGLMEIRNVPSAPTTLFLDPIGLPERDTYTWLSPGGTRYFLEYRSAVGTDFNVDSGHRIVVYTYDGHDTALYDEIRPGRQHKYGGKWIALTGAVPHKAKVTVHS